VIRHSGAAVFSPARMTHSWGSSLRKVVMAARLLFRQARTHDRMNTPQLTIIQLESPLAPQCLPASVFQVRRRPRLVTTGITPRSRWRRMKL
jgi:hypothetical protein